MHNRILLVLLLAITTVKCRSLGSEHDANVPVIQSNVSHSPDSSNLSGLATIFSPRMDFDQWKPLTGRGDPLRNDPTYDYEPPVLEKVHYWADETRLEREHYPERKSEVLMLGVSSRKPSATSRQPPLPPKRHQHLRPPTHKYEDFTYKLSDHYPMTILVPPPPPPPGHQPSLFTLPQEKIPNSHIKVTDSPLIITKVLTEAPNHITQEYALQEANLIYQSSTTNQNWILSSNQTKPAENNAVSTDYAGWGPTTPLNDNDSVNDTQNFIINDHVELYNHPYSFYKPMLSESPPPPPPPEKATSSLFLPTFLPTALLPTVHEEQVTESINQITWPTEETPYEIPTESHDYYEDTTTEKPTTIVFQPTPVPIKPTSRPTYETSMFDMLNPMMSMPLINGPDRPEDNLYAHASESMQVFKQQKPEDIIKLKTMQTMQPPPVMLADNATIPQKHALYSNSNNLVNSVLHNKPSVYTHDPYLHMRYTTPTTSTESVDKVKSTTETPIIPMYLIIQGHSKVKTYGSKPKPGDDKYTFNNEIPKPNETNEVRHLHPIKEKSAKKASITDTKRTSRAKNLQTLIEKGLGSIEIQETDIGIKYDVSDGSNVPVELYKKGIVDSDENSYTNLKKSDKLKRIKKQIEIEEYTYNFLEGKRNENNVTGLIAQAVTSNASNAVDELEDDDEQDEER